MMNCGKIIFPSKIFASGHLLNNSSCHYYLQKSTQNNDNGHPVSVPKDLLCSHSLPHKEKTAQISEEPLSAHIVPRSGRSVK